ncbi:MAG: GDP-mannose 4,6-dehydratase, partial [Planctomycetota bacterium]
MNIVITGGAGFIGSHLAEALLADGNSVTAIDDLSTGSPANVAHLRANPEFELVVESVTNQMVLDHLVRRADQVYHLAAAVGVKLIV